MAEPDDAPSEEPVDSTVPAAEAAEDDAVLLSHLRTDGDPEAVEGIEALRKQGAQLGEGDDETDAQTDPEFREGLRRRLVDETEGGEPETES